MFGVLGYAAWRYSLMSPPRMGWRHTAKLRGHPELAAVAVGEVAASVWKLGVVVLDVFVHDRGQMTPVEGRISACGW